MAVVGSCCSCSCCSCLCRCNARAADAGSEAADTWALGRIYPGQKRRHGSCGIFHEACGRASDGGEAPFPFHATCVCLHSAAAASSTPHGLLCWLSGSQPCQGRIPHCGSWSGCGGNPEGISDCRGSGSCGPGCRACGASTRWRCCGCSDPSSSHCLPGTSAEQAKANERIMFAERHGPMRCASIPGVAFPK